MGKIVFVPVVLGIVCIVLLLYVIKDTNDHLGECILLDSASAEDLANTYEPFICFYSGFFGEEEYFPTQVESMLSNATLRDSDRKEIEEYKEAPDRGAYLGTCHSENWYLDVDPQEGTIPKIAVDSEIKNQHRNDRHLYYRSVQCEYEGTTYIVIQYWFFYLYNDHVNDHEGEWEMILVLLDSNKVPRGAAYSRHEGGEYRSWDEIELEDGTHPVVYTAEGSHGAYFDEGIFSLQFSFDVTSDEGLRGLPYILTPLSEQPWLDYAGCWGYRWMYGFSGPQGPKQKGEKWYNPVEWAFNLEKPDTVSILSSFILVHLSCPADMVITNSAGEKLGYVEGEFFQDIPNSYVQDRDEEESYLIVTRDTYEVEIFGTGTEIFEFGLSTGLEDRTRTFIYPEIPVTPETEAVLSDLSFKEDTLPLEVTGQDGKVSIVFPDSIQLFCPEPVHLLQEGEITYEIEFSNQIFTTDDPSTFLFDVDTPQPWKYSLSSEVVSVAPGESERVTLTVIVPEGVPEKEYTIRVEATSSENTAMSVTLNLVVRPATALPELVAVDLTLAFEGDEPYLEVQAENTGSALAENVMIHVYRDSISAGNLLGKEAVEISPGDTVSAFISCDLPESLLCNLPEGLHTFLAVLDPDNLIEEFNESNNQVSTSFLVDRTPPEVEFFIDPVILYPTVRGIDNFDFSVYVMYRPDIVENVLTCTLFDDCGNTLELQLEILDNGEVVTGTIMSMKYSGRSVALPQNKFLIGYITEDGKKKLTNQFFSVENRSVELTYDEEENVTTIVEDGDKRVEEGMFVVVITTNKGEILFECIDFEDLPRGECVDFEDLPVGAEYAVGDTFSDSGVTLTVEPFILGGGAESSDGFVKVYNTRYAGGSGQEVGLTNATMRVTFGCTCSGLSLLFGHYKGNINIWINETFLNFAQFSDIDRKEFSGVMVKIIKIDENRGYLMLFGTIRSFAIGGQEVYIDSICYKCTGFSRTIHLV